MNKFLSTPKPSRPISVYSEGNMNLRRFVSADDLLSMFPREKAQTPPKNNAQRKKYATLQRNVQQMAPPSLDSPKLKPTFNPLSPNRKVENSVMSSAVKSSYISNEYLRIREFINRTDPDILQHILLRTLEYRNSKDIIALGIIFPRNHFPSINNFHCARCHKEFNPMDKDHCLIRHMTSMVRKIHQDEQGANFFCRSCGKTFYLKNIFTYSDKVNNHHTGFCFVGLHTNDARLVRYGTGAKTCEEYGCVEFYV